MELGIHFHDLGFCYPGRTAPALLNIDFAIPRASVFALLGPNGAGKTTLMRILCGRLHGYSGSLSIPDVWRTPEGLIHPRRFGVLVENPGVYVRLSVVEYLRYFGSFYEIPNLDHRIQFLSDRLEFSGLKQKMGALSLGMKQKVQIMRTFLHNPSLVLLDEPTANLDPLARECLWNLISQANREHGTTFIICSHLLGEMEQHCTELGFLRQGHLVASGSLEQIRKLHQAASRVVVQLSAPCESIQSYPEIHELGDLHVLENQVHYRTEHPERVNPPFISHLVRHGANIIEVAVHKASLGEIYRHFVEEKSA